ncbi:MAG: carboxymuconolactone decarboxylase family protein [Gammaproteobacteria bacterium]|nr:carboxymuconolactone decarboxylase family protein [Gammaproteobacteria bacterium]
MNILKPMDINDAPSESRETMTDIQNGMGFLPNLFGVMAHSPSTVKAYAKLDALFDHSSLDAIERQVVLMTASRLNDCGYCMAAHTGGAKSAGMDKDKIEALRKGERIEGDDKLEALRRFTADVVEKRGWVEDDAVKAFLDAGYEEAQVLDVILGVTMKTLSNYTNHIAGTPLDEELQPMEWKQAA